MAFLTAKFAVCASESESKTLMILALTNSRISLTAIVYAIQI